MGGTVFQKMVRRYKTVGQTPSLDLAGRMVFRKMACRHKTRVSWPDCSLGPLGRMILQETVHRHIMQVLGPGWCSLESSSRSASLTTSWSIVGGLLPQEAIPECPIRSLLNCVTFESAGSSPHSHHCHPVFCEATAAAVSSVVVLGLPSLVELLTEVFASSSLG